MSDADAADDVEPTPRTAPKLVRRDATARQALLAIALVFFVGVVIGFVLAHTL